MKNKKFERALELAAADQLLEERFYREPYEKLEHHQKIKCHVQGLRALKVVRAAIVKYRNM